MLEDNQPEETTTEPTGEAPAESGSAEAPAGRQAAKATAKRPAKKTSTRRTTKKAEAPSAASGDETTSPEPDSGAPVADGPAVAEAADKAPASKAAKRAPRRSARSTETAPEPSEAATTPEAAAAAPESAADATATDSPETAETAEAVGAPAARKRAPRKTAAKKTAAKKAAPATEAAAEPGPAPDQADVTDTPAAGAVPLFQAPDASAAPARRTRKSTAKKVAADTEPAGTAAPETETPETATPDTATPETAGAAEQTADQADQTEGEESDVETSEESGEGGGSARRRRRRGGRRRRKSGDSQTDDNGAGNEGGDSDESDEDTQAGQSDEQSADTSDSTSSRRRRRRRRAGEEGTDAGDDDANTVTRVRKTRSAEDQITSLAGSTRLEAKKQRRREGREAGRRRAPIVSEAEFLARRESVDRVMVIRQREDLTQIGVLEDKVLVEHYVARESQTSLIGNVYLGRVQNVLPSMEAAFIDIGKGRNAVLYAGEVNWSALGHKDGQPRKIESVLSSGQSILVQVTKDPVGHKGARLTSQISLAGRFLVYVPDGTNSGISRKLPDTERNRLKSLLKEIVPDSAGVIVRTAAEGASEEELTRDVERLKARWDDIEAKTKGSAPQLLYGEPDLTLKVVRDLFTEDFSKLVIQGDDAWDTVRSYVAHVAPDLEERLERYEPGADGQGGKADVFAEYRIEEQIKKGLDRKVWLPSGGSLIIDRTEAMTVVDVNTGKFTGSGGNLEETVTKNNLEAAEEIVRQLRLRDIGGIIVVDFIDMVLESNRDLVVRRLVECLGRDRTRHQVAEVTSLGLVQMTRKRIGTGLLEAFSVDCDHCHGRGVVIQDVPVEPAKGDDDGRRGGRRRGRGRDSGSGGNGAGSGAGSGTGSGTGNGKDRGDKADGGSNGRKDSGPSAAPSPAAVAAMAKAENAAKGPADGLTADGRPLDVTPGEPRPAPSTEPAQSTPSAEPSPSAGSTQPTRPTQSTRSTPPEEPVAPLVQPEAPRDTGPKVVTRTRRRAASRPAGPPTATLPTTEPATESADSSAGRPAPELDQVTPLAGVGSPPETGMVEPGTADVEPGPESADQPAPEIEHVPVKKKGSRKR